MTLTCNLRIDFAPGPVPGQLQAALKLVSPDGHVIAVGPPDSVAANMSLTFGPVQVLVGLPAAVGPTPPPPKGVTAGQAAVALAAAGS